VAFAELEFFKIFKYKINAGFESSAEQYKYIRKVGNWTLNQPFDPSMAAESKGRYQSTLLENTLSFNKEIGKHRLDGVVGTTYQTQLYEQIGGVKRNLVFVGGDYYRVLNAGTSNPESSGFINEDALISYLGRVNYSFDGKYFITGTIRRDGSSKFSKENRWGNFPSVSVAWRISQEPFFKVPWISDFKIRANYGTLGNSSIGRWIGYGGSFYGSSVYNIGNWDYMSLLNTSVINVLGRDQRLVNGATQVKLANADLKWETQTQTNFGVDLAFLENKLSATAEYFVSTTTDVLTPMPILLSTGNDGGDPFANAAEIRNRGFELSATWKENRGGFNYSVTANFSTLQNEVLDLGYGKEEYITWMTKTEIGEPIGMFYLRKTDGLFRSAQDVQNHKNSSGLVIQPNAKPGDIRYVDFNDDGQINDADRQIVGNPWPVCDLGLNISMAYKGIDFSMMWYGAFGQDVYNGPRSTAERFDDNSNYFTFREGNEPYQENPNSDFPRLLYGDDRNSRGDTDRWLEDGSYFKLRNVTLGYTLPKRIMQAAKFEEMRVYVTGQNLLTFTKYLGLDPDFTAPDLWRRGHDEVRYPNARSISLGIQFKF
jgi:TonB-linked SusC/RagA family outer membrane protein